MAVSVRNNRKVKLAIAIPQLLGEATSFWLPTTKINGVESSRKLQVPDRKSGKQLLQSEGGSKEKHEVQGIVKGAWEG